jgi:hypothetical protein
MFAVNGFLTAEALRTQRFFEILLFGFSGRITAANSILIRTTFALSAPLRLIFFTAEAQRAQRIL